ncbi:MAG: hypothetical protein K2F87_05750 [Muribaculaceae bacterium]|nr:hypothetical protein [Muribaculaceae bacterium]
MIDRRRRHHLPAFVFVILTLLTLPTGCESVDDTRIPSYPVYIDLSNQGIWNTYGVSGFGSFNYFVCQTGSAVEPSGFPYKDGAATGFGGVLVIEGMDPFALQTSIPLAYDLSCPVEKSPTIRVAIDTETFEAVCPVCGSHYDVTMGAGAPVSGPALTGSRQYGLRRYYCHPTTLGGYIINDFK